MNLLVDTHATTTTVAPTATPTTTTTNQSLHTPPPTLAMLETTTKGWRVGLQLCSPPCPRDPHRPTDRDLPRRPPRPPGRAARCALPGAAAAASAPYRCCHHRRAPLPTVLIVFVSGAERRQRGGIGHGGSGAYCLEQ